MPAAAPSILGSTGSTTIVLAALLVALGLVMVGATVWLVRATRTDTRALGPLEVMGDRRFPRRDPDARAAVLAGARPEGAVGPSPMIDVDDEEPASEPEPELGVEPEPEREPVVEPVPEPAVETEPDAVSQPEPVVEPEAIPEAGDSVDDDEPAPAAPRAN